MKARPDTLDDLIRDFCGRPRRLRFRPVLLAAWLLTLAVIVGGFTGCIEGKVGRIGSDVKAEAARVAASDVETSVTVRQERKVYGVEFAWARWGFGLGGWPVIPADRLKSIVLEEGEPEWSTPTVIPQK